jgi:hypothetical protein
MERKRPVAQNNLEIPVNIYKGEDLIAECSNIQEAARIFKKETGSNRFNWSAINKGIWYGESYSLKGATYFFLTDKEVVRKKLNIE